MKRHFSRSLTALFAVTTLGLFSVSMVASVFVEPANAAVCCACRVRTALNNTQHTCWFIQQPTVCSAIPVNPGDTGSGFWSSLWTGIRPSEATLHDSDCFPVTAEASHCSTDGEDPWTTSLCESQAGIMSVPRIVNEQGNVVQDAAITRGAEAAIPLASTTQGVPGAISESTVEFRSLKPVLSVPIPGVNFDDATLENGVVTIPFLAQYILGIYKFAIAAAALLASIMVVYGGFRYLLGSTLGDIKGGKEIIQNAIIGLVVLLCSYVILRSLNPALVNLQPIQLNYVERLPETVIARELGTDEGGGGTAPTCLSGSGRYWSSMNAVCQSQHVANLNDVQKLTFLRQIIDVWKRVGVDLHGSIYVRGGSASCRDVNVNNVQGQGHGNVVAGFLKKMERNIAISQLGLSAACATSLSGHTDDSDHGQPCYNEYWAAYNRVYMTRFRAAGIYCADCIANVRNIYNCFGGTPYYQRVGDIRSKTCRENSVFNFTGNETDAEITAGIARLHFGDFIVDGSHAYIFTGNAGLGYEIMEMGTTSGYTSEGRANMLGHSAPLNYSQINLPGASQGGGMAVYRQALPYLKEKVAGAKRERNRGNTTGSCVTAIRGMPEIPDTAYQALSSTPLQPFTLPATPPTVNQEPGTNTCTAAPAGGSGGSGTGSSGSSGATSGGVTTRTFNYTPTSIGWRANQSVIMFPERLTREFASIPAGGARPQIRVYMYIHGGPNGATKPPNEAAYFGRMQTALQSVAGQKNILIIAPHYWGGTGSEMNFMNGLDINRFYASATQAFLALVPGAQPSDIVDSVIGGHSMANCRDGVLSQAVQRPLPHQRGIVLYDGCLGADSFSHNAGEDITPRVRPDEVQPATYPVPAAGNNYGSLYFNPDIGGGEDAGMGRSQSRAAKIIQKWGLTAGTCPTSISSVNSAATCASQAIGSGTNAREVFSITTSVGHGDSVLPMTKMMFNTFYR